MIAFPPRQKEPQSVRRGGTARADVKSLPLLALLLATPVQAQQIVKTDEQWASEGEYIAYASPWCRYLDPVLKEGRDYSNSLSWSKGGLPNGVQITWRYSVPRKPVCGVFGYNFVAWGNYDNGLTLTPVMPRQVKSLTAFTMRYGVDVAADPTSYNGLMEFYLTRAPAKNGGPLDKALEVGWFWHTPLATQAWVKTGASLGIFTDRFGVVWSVARTGTFVTFTPAGGTRTWGTVDAKASLDYLRAKGVVSGDWWLNGAALGVEPLSGFGTAIVRAWVIEVR